MREFYDKNGELAPTPKGICLPEPQWQTLSSNLQNISRAAEAMLGAPLQAATPSNAPGEPHERRPRTDHWARLRLRMLCGDMPGRIAPIVSAAPHTL